MDAARTERVLMGSVEAKRRREHVPMRFGQTGQLVQRDAPGMTGNVVGGGRRGRATEHAPWWQQSHRSLTSRHRAGTTHTTTAPEERGARRMWQTEDRERERIRLPGRRLVTRHRCAHRRPGRLQNRRRLRARYEGYLEILNRNYCACAGAGFQ